MLSITRGQQKGSHITAGNNGMAYCSAYCANNWNREMPSDWQGACCTSAVKESGETISCLEKSTSKIACTCARDDSQPFLSSRINEDERYTCEAQDIVGECSQKSVGRTCFVHMGSNMPAKQGACAPHSDSLPVDWWCDVGQAEPCTNKFYDDKCNFEGKEGFCNQHIGKTFCDIWTVRPTEKTYCVKVQHDGKVYCGAQVSRSRPAGSKVFGFLAPLLMLFIISQ